ncbi:MAG: hypothetical protein H7Z41_17155 [Cytophagales bacterium]|nr:hypothetical protein [Armatimonadota bacterium]
MRVILKPGGLVLITLALTALAILAFGKWKNPVPEKGASAAVAARSAKNPRRASGDRTATGKGAAGSLISPTAEKWSLATQPPADADMTLFVADDLPGNDKHALHLNIRAVDANKFWAAQLIKRVPIAVKSGHSVNVHFYGRSKTGNSTYVVFEEGNIPHTPELSQQVQFTPQWKEYNFPFVTKKDHSEVHANFCLKASITPGELDIAQLNLVDGGVAN